jgi:hypothetical protein
VVVDYLWGRSTELLLEALAQGFDPNAARSTRLVEVGESAGKSITLPGVTLRSIDLKVMGSGFGSVPLERVLNAIPRLFTLAAAGSLKVAADAVPLSETWKRRGAARRAGSASYLRPKRSGIRHLHQNTPVIGNTFGGCRCLRE